MRSQDRVPHKRERHIVGKPHVADIDHDGHNRVEEETNFCPPSGPNDDLASYDRIETGKARKTDCPDIDVLAVRLYNVIVLEDEQRNVIHPKRMYQSKQILQVILFPGE